MPDSLLKIPSDQLPAGWLDSEAAPLEIDVGCHKGLFLVEMAGRFPERNFFGVECQKERVEKTRQKIRARGLTNAAVVQAEGETALKALPDICVDFIHVLFPDPWPKRRHQVRRLIQGRFLAVVCRVLRPAGFLRLVTDDGEYAQAMEDAVMKCSGLIREVSEDREYPATEFQKKFLLDQRPIYSLLLRRIGSGGEPLRPNGISLGVMPFGNSARCLHTCTRPR